MDEFNAGEYLNDLSGAQLEICVGTVVSSPQDDIYVYDVEC